MTSKQFLTISGRWKQHAQAAGLDQRPREEQAKAMLLFFAGFSAALDATMEIAELDELEAMRMLSCMHEEVKLVAGAAAAMTRAATPGGSH